MIWRSNLDGTRRAAFSPCGAYRFILLISWDMNLPRMASVGLNPSTADEFKNDPTLAQECERAKRMGFGSLLKTNLFALRATNPKDMLKAKDPFGEWTLPYDIQRAIIEHEADKFVCATWGNHGQHRGRAQAFRETASRMGLNLYAYKVNQSGEPCHPLYKSYDVNPTQYLWAAREGGSV